MLKNTAWLIFSFFVVFSWGQTTQTTWLQHPALSPNGEKIAFTYQGDVYVMSTQGGLASPLLVNNGYASDLKWSSDSNYIAMAIEKNNQGKSVYVVSLQDGLLKRLTWDAYPQTPLGFTADSRRVILSASLLSDEVSTISSALSYKDVLSNQLFSVSVTGGKLKPILPVSALNASLSHNEKYMAYTPANNENLYRQRNVSWSSPSVFVVDLDNLNETLISKRRISAYNPVWAAQDNALFYLDETSGSFNVWKHTFKGEKKEQITFHTRYPVRYLTASKNNDLAYVYQGNLYVKKHNQSSAVKIVPRISNAYFNEKKYIHTNDFQIKLDAELKQGAAIRGGNLFTFDTVSGQTRLLFDSPYEQANPSFVSDGRSILFNSDHAGRWGAYVAHNEDEQTPFFIDSNNIVIETVFEGDFDAKFLTLSPDETKIAYLRDHHSLYVYDLHTDEHQAIALEKTNYSYEDGDIMFSWAPDSKHLALMFAETFENFELYVVSTDVEEKPVRITYSMGHDGYPIWSSDGQSIFFIHEGGSNTESGLYRVFLTQQAFAQDQSQLAAYKSIEPEDNTDPSEQEDHEQVSQDAISDESNVLPIVVEQEGIGKRLQLVVSGEDITFFQPMESSDSVFFMHKTEDGEYNLYTQSLQKENQQLSAPEPLVDIFWDSNFITWSHEEDALIGYNPESGSLQVLNIPNVFLDTLRLFSFDAFIEQKDLENAVMKQFDRLTALKVLETTEQKKQWKEDVAYYQKFLPHINDIQDFQIILSELSGGLNLSHTGASLFPSENYMGNLGLIYDRHYQDNGMKVDAILSNTTWKNIDLRIQKGDIIMAVNGQAIQNEHTLERLMERQRDRLVTLSMRNEEGETWVNRVFALSSYAYQHELYEYILKKTQDYVSEKTDNRVGYVYIPEMDVPSFKRAQNDALTLFDDAKTLITDIRFNSGGNTHDMVLDFLEHKPRAKIRSNGLNKTYRGIFDTIGGWGGESILLVNGFSYSDASIMARLYKQFEIGVLLGEPVPGTGTAVWWASSNLLPNLAYGLPQTSMLDVKTGEKHENNEVQPDVLILQDIKATKRGIDRQLDAAIQVALDAL